MEAPEISSPQISSPQISSLFGWSNLAINSPPKVVSFDHLFTNVNQHKPDIALCIDGSGSTLFDTNKAFDGMKFSEIYAEALKCLFGQLPKGKVICWSNIAKELAGQELDDFNNAIENRIPFANIITGMNGGTDPQHILPFVKDKTVVLVTDGQIVDQAINAIRSKIPNSGISSVFLIIVPHIDDYKGMYSQNVEMNAKDNIRLSIPQAFSERLATVIIWNYKKRAFELISELSTPWLDTNKSMSEILNSNLPTIVQGQFLIKFADTYKSFSLDRLIDFLLNNSIDEMSIGKLVEMGITAAIRQQATIQQRDKWNDSLLKIFHQVLNAKVKKDFVEKAVPDNATMMERIKITGTNERELRKLSDEYRNQLAKVFGNLLIDKIVGEMTNVAAAKAVQTQANVSLFQKMSVEDKLNEILPALIKSECGICGSNTNVFKTVSIPAKLLVQMMLCKEERIINKKKGKPTTVNSLNIDGLKTALQSFPPHFHFLNLCGECANVSLKQAQEVGDPEYGITKLVPQNINADHVVVERLMLLPCIEPELIADCCDPNEAKLSYCRQMLRGFLSRLIGLDPAGQDTLTAALMFLSSLATDKENAIIVFAFQKSLLSGGRNNRYMETVGRLFKPNAKKISSEVLTLISLTEEVIEKAGMEILPESNKLLLLCLLERKVSILINAKNCRDRAMKKMNDILEELRSGALANEMDKFDISPVHLETIKSSSSVDDFKKNNEVLCNKFLAAYLQNALNINLQQVAQQEAQLMKVLGGSKIEDMSSALFINNDYLQKMVERSKMTPEDFIAMVPKFLGALVSSDGKHNTEIMMQFI